MWIPQSTTYHTRQRNKLAAPLRSARLVRTVVFASCVVVLLLLNGAQAQQQQNSSEILYRIVWEPFRLYPEPSFSCGWGDSLLGLSRAQLIRDAAEDCLRAQVPMICGVNKNADAFSDNMTDIALLSSVSCEGTYVRLLGGKVSFPTRVGAPTREEVQQCVQEVLEGPACLLAIQSADSNSTFSTVQSIVYASDVPVAAPTNSPTIMPSLTSLPPTTLPSPTTSLSPTASLPPPPDQVEINDNGNNTTVTEVSQGESSTKATSDSSTLFGLTNGTAIVAAAVMGAVLMAALALFARQQRRRGSNLEQGQGKDVADQSIPLDTLPQNTTLSLDDVGDQSYDSYDDEYDDGDMENGSKMSLSALDSLHQPSSAYQAKDVTSPSATSNSRKGGLRLVTTVPVLYSLKSLRKNSASLPIGTRTCTRSCSRRSRSSLVGIRTLDSPDEETSTSIASDAVTHLDQNSLRADRSLISVAEVDGESTDTANASHIPDDYVDVDDNDDRCSILQESGQKQTYDTRSVLTTLGSDDLANDLSQEVIMVDSGPSWKSRWIRPNILPTLRSGGRNSSSVANNISSELYISAVDDDASSSDSSRQSSEKKCKKNELKAAAIGNVASTEDADDDSLDFRPTQDWNPDDSEASPEDDMSNGELSFWASKKTTELRSRTGPPHQPAPEEVFSTTVSTASQQGEEIDGLDILEHLRLSPTLETSLQPSGSRRLTPRALLRKMTPKSC